MKFPFAGVLTGLIALTYWCCKPTESHTPPAYLTEKLNDGIPIGTLSEVGIDSTAIFNLSTQIESGIYPNIHSLLIYRKNNWYLSCIIGVKMKFGVMTSGS